MVASMTSSGKGRTRLRPLNNAYRSCMLFVLHTDILLATMDISTDKAAAADRMLRGGARWVRNFTSLHGLFHFHIHFHTHVHFHFTSLSLSPHCDFHFHFSLHFTFTVTFTFTSLHFTFTFTFTSLHTTSLSRLLSLSRSQIGRASCRERV